MGNFDTAADMLEGCGLANIVERCPGHDDIRYIKFVPHVEQSGRVFSAVALETARILTMVLVPRRHVASLGPHRALSDALEIKS